MRERLGEIWGQFRRYLAGAAWEWWDAAKERPEAHIYSVILGVILGSLSKLAYRLLT